MSPPGYYIKKNASVTLVDDALKKCYEKNYYYLML